MTKIAFIGFGEAGSLLASGLKGAGARVERCYDILIHEQDDKADALKQRAATAGMEAVASQADAVADADIVISAVTTSKSVGAAEATAPHLKAGQIFFDINSIAPPAKRKAAEAVEQGGAHFVEAAVMDLVPPHGHTVPMLLAGEKAQAVADMLSPYGMNLRVVGSDIGAASAVKMVRSVYMKGFTAVLLECLVAAKVLDAEDAVLESLQVTFPQMDWKELADYYIPRLIRHATRQGGEMESVAETLEELGIEPITAVASGKRLKWLGDMKLSDRDELPEGYNALLAEILKHSRK